MIGQRGIIGIAILAFLGSIVGLCMLGVWLPSAIGSGFVIAFFAGAGAASWGVGGSSVIVKSQPYQNVKYGTAASEVMELRQGFTSSDVARMNEDNRRSLRGE